MLNLNQAPSVAPSVAPTVVENSTTPKKLSKTAIWALVVPFLDQMLPEIKAILETHVKPKAGTSKDWSRVIGLMLSDGKSFDIARECSITGLWHYAKEGSKSSQIPITSNRVSKAVTDVVKVLNEKALNDFQTAINSGDLATAQKYMALATDNISSEKDASGEVIKNKFEVEVEMLQALYPTEYTSLLNQGIEIFKSEGKIIGSTKEEAYNYLPTLGYDINSLILEA